MFTTEYHVIPRRIRRFAHPTVLSLHKYTKILVAFTDTSIHLLLIEKYT